MRLNHKNAIIKMDEPVENSFSSGFSRRLVLLFCLLPLLFMSCAYGSGIYPAYVIMVFLLGSRGSISLYVTFLIAYHVAVGQL